MECVLVQWIDHVLESAWSIDTDEGIVDRIWHRSIDSPVPVWNSECGRCCLIPGFLSCRVGDGDLLGIIPENLLY